MASKAVVKFNTKALLQKQQKAFQIANEELTENFTAEFIAPKWGWDGTTQRRNGSVVASPRSLVDTGALLDSYERRRDSPTQYTHAWRERYALVVALGAVLKNGGVIEGRNWTTEPLKHFGEVYARAYRSLS